jgi:hypothetical protein
VTCAFPDAGDPDLLYILQLMTVHVHVRERSRADRDANQKLSCRKQMDLKRNEQQR